MATNLISGWWVSLLRRFGPINFDMFTLGGRCSICWTRNQQSITISSTWKIIQSCQQGQPWTKECLWTNHIFDVRSNYIRNRTVWYPPTSSTCPGMCTFIPKIPIAKLITLNKSEKKNWNTGYERKRQEDSAQRSQSSHHYVHFIGSHSQLNRNFRKIDR